MTAEDVKATYDRFLTATNLASNKCAGWLKSTEIIDDYTVVINLTSPMSSFYSERSQTPIIPSWAIEDIDAFFDLPVGTGPHTMVLHDSATGEIKWIKNEFWWGWSEGYTSDADIIYHKYGKDDAARIAGLESGEYQVIEDITRASDDVLAKLDEEGWNLINFMKAKHYYLLLNFTDLDSPIQDEKVREALSLCINRTVYAEESYGFAEAATWPCQLTDLGFEAGGYEYNVEKAKQLVAESSYDGSPIYFSANEKSVTALSAMAAEVGINIVAATGDYYDIYVDSKGSRLTEINDVIGKDEYNQNYNEEEWLKLVATAMAAIDSDDLKAARDDVYKYMMENFAPNIYLYERYGRVIADPDVSGFDIIPSDYTDYRFVKIS